VSSHHQNLVLDVLATDNTFSLGDVRGAECWVGKCIFCNSRLVVGVEGGLSREVTLEHIKPRHHGGTDDVENLALACRCCNNEKGIRHDRLRADNPRAMEIIEKLAEKRRRRLRHA
jgi:5-methylcytosine-specific restriction endonuclease McrA